MTTTEMVAAILIAEFVVVAVTLALVVMIMALLLVLEALVAKSREIDKSFSKQRVDITQPPLLFDWTALGALSLVPDLKTMTAPPSVVGFAVKSCRFHVVFH